MTTLLRSLAGHPGHWRTKTQEYLARQRSLALLPCGPTLPFACSPVGHPGPWHTKPLGCVAHERHLVLPPYGTYSRIRAGPTGRINRLLGHNKWQMQSGMEARNHEDATADPSTPLRSGRDDNP